MKQRTFVVQALAFLLISVQIALYVFIWIRLLGDPSLRGMDFISFYTAGRIARQGDYARLYSLEAQRAVQHTIVEAETFPGGVNLSQHPPYLAPLLSMMLAEDDFVRSYILWTMARLAVAISCGELIRCFLLRSGWDPSSALLGVLGLVFFFPFFLGLLSGQDTAFIMFGLLLWMVGLLGGHEARAGIGLAIASLSPLVTAALGPPLLSSRRKAGLWFILAMSLLGIYSFALVGIQGTLDFIDLLTLSSRGEGYGLNQMRMYNLLGLLLRGLPNLSTDFFRQVAWVAFVVSIVILIVLWWNKGDSLRMEHIGLSVILSVFTLPHLHSHGLSYLILPMLGLLTIFWSRGDKTAALLFVPSISIALMLISLLKPEWDFTAYYLLMFALAYGLWSNLRSGKTSEHVQQERTSECGL